MKEFEDIYFYVSPVQSQGRQTIKLKKSQADKAVQLSLQASNKTKDNFINRLDKT